MRVIHNDKYTNSTGITGRPKMKTRAAAQPTTAAKAERNEAGVRDETSIASDNLLEKKKEENKEELGEQMKANKETAQAARDREQQAAETAATTASNSSGRGPRIIRRTRNGEEKSPGGEAPRLQMYKKMRYQQEGVQVNTEQAIRDIETFKQEQAIEKERKKDRRREYRLEEEANERWAERNEGTP